MANISQAEATKWLPNGRRDGDEKIVLFLRRHWFVLVLKYLFLLLLSVVPFGVYALLSAIDANFFRGDITYPITVLIVSLYYLFIWVTFFTTFIDYYLDVWIVTTHRIIDREQKGLFNLTISEQSLGMVQDVSSNVKGVLPTLLDYGNVLIQSAAAKGLFQFKQIPEPDIIAREIHKLAAEFREKHEQENV